MNSHFRFSFFSFISFTHAMPFPHFGAVVFFVFFVQIVRPCKLDSGFRRSGFFVFFVPIMQSGEGKTAFSPHPRPGMRLSIWTNEKDSSNTNVRCCRFSPTSPAALSLSLSLSRALSLSHDVARSAKKRTRPQPSPGSIFSTPFLWF